ncbi:hypothetical protein D3C76_936180 [compost metagenome]
MARGQLDVALAVGRTLHADTAAYQGDPYGVLEAADAEQGAQHAHLGGVGGDQERPYTGRRNIEQCLAGLQLDTPGQQVPADIEAGIAVQGQSAAVAEGNAAFFAYGAAVGLLAIGRVGPGQASRQPHQQQGCAKGLGCAPGFGLGHGKTLAQRLAVTGQGIVFAGVGGILWRLFHRAFSISRGSSRCARHAAMPRRRCFSTVLSDMPIRAATSA